MVCRVPHNEVVQVVNDALAKRIGDIDQIQSDLDADVTEVKKVADEINSQLANLPDLDNLASETGAALVGTKGNVTLQAKLDSIDNTTSGQSLQISNQGSAISALTTEVANKADINSPALTGTPTVPTADSSNNSTQIANTAFVAALGALKANLASPTFTGTPLAPTAASGTNTTQIATTAFVASAMAALVNSAPGTLDTLKELADALGDDPNFATTISNSLALKAPLASPALTGTPTAPTAETGTSNNQLATTAFVANAANLKLDSIGVSDSSEATAGTIGEYKSASQTSAVSLTSATAANIISLSLQPGDWDVEGIATFVTAANANGTNWAIGLSTSSATMATDQAYLANLQPGTAQTIASTVRLHTATCRFNISVTTTIYLVGVAAFTANTSNVVGTIRARRVR